MTRGLARHYYYFIAVVEHCFTQSINRLVSGTSRDIVGFLAHNFQCFDYMANISIIGVVHSTVKLQQNWQFAVCYGGCGLLMFRL